MGIIPSASYSVTVRLEVPSEGLPPSLLTSAVEKVGGMVTAFDVTAARGDKLQVDLTVAAPDAEHEDQITGALAAVPGVVVGNVSDRVFLLHIGGKIEITSKVPLKTRDDLSMAYTPGVARICRAIAERPEDVRRLTIKRNTVAVLTDGSAVLGLGNIGPAAALPVMEGKAALFKRFAGIDAFPICLDTQDTEEIIRTAQVLSPVFGGINLEDIAAPRCFEIERRLRDLLDIPVFHDDQHGTAIVVLAALINALRVVDKPLQDVRIVMSGAGAAGHAILELLLLAGATDVVVGDIHGIVHAGRDDLDPSLAWIAGVTNTREFTGSIGAACAGADVFIGVSAADVLIEADVASMADDSIVFALANPDPEIDPVLARRHARVVATGRSDFPNQINNVLAFPGVFRGLLDAQSRSIPESALLAAARALADVVADDERQANYIIPSVFHPDLSTTVAAAVSRAVSDAGADA
ncbi:MAG: NAD-dependent malic enzyme [Ilumatobacteraceae bacterium]